LLRSGLRHHLARPLASLLTVLGIAAGVALLVAMQLAQGTAEAAFDRGLRALAGEATHVVDGAGAGVPLAVYRDLRLRCRGRAVAPVVAGVARAGAAGGLVLRVLGIDPLADAELRPWSLGTAAGGSVLAELLTEPGACVASAELLQQAGLAVGEPLALTIGGRPVAARCVGRITPPAAVAPGLADVLVVDLATAQEWFDRPDRLDRLELRLPTVAPGTADSAPSPEALAAALPAGVQLRAVGQSQTTLAELARGFRTNLRALGLLSLLVGAFLVHETMRVAVAARRPAFAVLRALGAPPRALLLTVAAEALAFGAVGSLLGTGLGTAAAQQLLGPLVQSLNDHYATFAVPALQVDAAVLAAGLLLGVGTALAAGLLPAWAAASVSGREVLVAARTPQQSRALPRLVVAGAAAGLATVLLATAAQRLVQAYCGLLAVVVALVAVVPVLQRVVLAGLATAAAGRSVWWRHVVRSTAAGRDAVALPVAALVLALAVTLGLGTMVHSFRRSVDEWLGQVLPADVYVSVPAGPGERTAAGIEPALVAALGAAPGTAAVATFHRTRLPVAAAGRSAEVEVCGMAPTQAVLEGFGFVAGDERQGRVALRSGTGLWVSEPLAQRLDLAVGQPLTITTAAGPATLPVVAIHRDYASERGEVIAPAAWLLARTPVAVTALALHAAPGTAVPALVRQLRDLAAGSSTQELWIRSNHELRRSSLAVFDRTFAITAVMRLLCLLVAGFGIYAAFAALQLERAAEVGLLRCLGATPRWIAASVLGQTALLGLLAGLFAVPAGALFGHLLAGLVNRVSFGWTLPAIEVPPMQILEVLALGLGAALLAGVLPARRFAALRPVVVLRDG
jgi:putative ABC transport system permease protein